MSSILCSQHTAVSMLWRGHACLSCIQQAAGRALEQRLTRPGQKSCTWSPCKGCSYRMLPVWTDS